MSETCPNCNRPKASATERTPRPACYVGVHTETSEEFRAADYGCLVAGWHWWRDRALAAEAKLAGEGRGA